MLTDQSFDVVEFWLRESSIGRQLNRVEPKLDDMPIPFHMNMHRLTTIRTEENKTVRAIAQDGRHGVRLTSDHSGVKRCQDNLAIRSLHDGTARDHKLLIEFVQKEPVECLCW